MFTTQNIRNMEIKTVGILLFEDVELLDFAGPLEVFGAADYVKEDGLYTINTVAQQKEIRTSKGLLHVTADHILSHQYYDLFIIPGGFGTRPIVKDPESLRRIDDTISQSKITASVCTGALILAKLGHLKNMEVCSHHLSFDTLESIDPSVIVNRKARYIDNDRFITSAGVSAGIDMSFHILSRYFGQELSDTTRKYIEYFPESVT